MYNKKIFKTHTWLSVHKIFIVIGMLWTLISGFNNNGTMLCVSITMMICGFVGFVSVISMSED